MSAERRVTPPSAAAPAPPEQPEEEPSNARSSRWDQQIVVDKEAHQEAARQAAIKAKAALEAIVVDKEAHQEAARQAAIKAKASLEAQVNAAVASRDSIIPVPKPEDRPEGGMYSVAPGSFGRVFYPPAQPSVTKYSGSDRRTRSEEADVAERKPRQRRRFTEADDDENPPRSSDR